MDCDDVTVLVAGGDARTLPEEEQDSLHRHLADCPECRELTSAPDETSFRWIVRVPEDALDDPDLLALPVVDPIVFAADRELARGGMGRITRARDRRLGRDVAIKEVLEPRMRARFEREAMITAQLQHPAIVPVYEAGTWPSGSAFYTMRLVPGGTLADAIAKTETLEQRLALLPHVVAVIDALAYAHARRIVHRDLKAGNVLVGEFGETVVIDWGLAKVIGRDVDIDEPAHRISASDLTVVGAVMGTPGFMSPEQAAGDAVDERTDVFALGAILYNLLAGRAPYADRGFTRSDELVAYARDRAPTPLAELAPDVPADLLAIVDRAMSRRAGDRYASAKDMADELRRFAAGQLIRSRQYGAGELLARWVRRHLAAVVVAAIAFAVVAAVGIGAIVSIARSRADERAARRVAEDSTAGLLEEQGRNQLLAGDRERALAYLAEAYGRGRDGDALRHMLAVATRDLELRDGTAAVSGDVLALGYDAGGRPVSITRDAFAGSLAHAALGPAAREVAVVTGGGNVALYDVASRTRRWEAPGSTGARIVFAPTGRHLVVLHATQPAELRDAATGALVRSLSASSRPPAAAAFQSDGARVAVGDDSGEFTVWDVATGAEVRRTSIHHDISLMAFVRDMVATASIDRDDVQVWNLHNDIPFELSGHNGMVRALAVDPAGHMLAVADDRGGVRLWSDEGSRLGEARDHRGSLTALAFSPSGTLLAGAGADHRAYVWRAPSLELLRSVPAFTAADASQRSLAWSADGTRFATAAELDRTVATWRAPAGHRIAQRDAGAFAVAGSTVFAVATEGLDAVRADTGAVTAHTSGSFDRVRASDDGNAVVWGRTGARLVPGGAIDGEPLGIGGGRVLVRVGRTLRLGDRTLGEADAAALSADGAYVLAIARDKPVAWRATGEAVALPALSGSGVSFAPAGTRAVVFGDAGASVVDVATGRLVAGRAGAVTDASLDAAGRKLVLWHRRAVRLVDVDTGAALLAVDGVPHGGFAIDRAGARLATASFDGYLRVWDVASGRLLEVIACDGRAGLAWTADGTRLVAGDPGHVVVLDEHLETRSPSEIGALADRATGWRVEQGLLVPSRQP